jgi:phosphohistidine phosphatase
VKRVYLLRHAKSSWDDPTLNDHERPLAPRGEKAAKRMGRHLRDLGVQPDEVVCSPAVRARQTLERLRPFLDRNVKVDFEPAIYGAGPDQLLTRLRQVPDAVGSIMLIGHNPGLQELAVSLVDDHDANRAHLAEAFPTAALAALAVPVEAWASIRPGQAHVEHFVLARELKA